MKTTEMVPRLRFKDENGGDFSNWDRSQFGEIVERIKKRNNGVSRNVLTISAQYGLINQEEYFNKSVASSNSDNYYLLKKGDFAYNKSYSKGYPLGAIKRLTSYEEGIVSPLYICFRSRRNIHNDFLSLYFDSQKINAQLYKIVQEGARNHGLLNMSIDDFFNSIYLVIPTLQEQKKIASFLSSVDEKISQLEKKKTLFETYKRGIMQKIFSQELRFKDENGQEFPDWEVTSLGSVSIVNMGQSPDSKSYNNNKDGIPLIQGNADIQNRMTKPRQFTSSPTKKCIPNDIIMTVRAPVGYVSLSKHHACIGRGVCSISSTQHSEVKFLYQLLLNMEDQWYKLEQGSTFTAVSGKDINNLKITIPGVKEQKKIASFLSSVDKKIEITSTRLEKTREFKKGLLQQMFV